jgi:peptidoglycan/LPS O-acetylase OafA/YrhL
MNVGLAMYFWRSWFRADVELLGWVGVLKSYALLPQKPYPFINPGWSLEYEVIFYAIVAVLYPLTGIWGVFVLMLGLSTAANAFKPADGYHLVDGSYLFFGAGIVAYLLRNRSWREAAPLAAGGACVGIRQVLRSDSDRHQRGHGGARHWVCGTAGSRCFA